MSNFAESKRILRSSGGIILSVALIGLGVVVRGRVDRQGDGPHQNFMVSRDSHPETSVADTYQEVSQLLKQEYVEAVRDEMKLASGGVRGMVTSLGDPESLFMDKDEFRVYKAERRGDYEGIGAELALVLPSRKEITQGDTSPIPAESPEEELATASRIPKLTVVSLTPGGPAEQAGVKIGDVVDSVDGHWVVNSDLIDEFNKARKQFLAHKMSVNEINTIRKQLRARTERALVPIKARQKLIIGDTGSVKVTWKRNKTSVDSTIPKGHSHMSRLTVSSGTVVLPFTTGISKELKTHLAPTMTIDLRNNAAGDFEEMRKCLAVVAKSGTYGWIRTMKKEKPLPLAIAKGNPSPPKLKLLVDGSTRGAAEIFAEAMAKFGGATLSGTRMGNERSIVESVFLPDGTGYSLVTGEYSATKGATK